MQFILQRGAGIPSATDTVPLFPIKLGSRRQSDWTADILYCAADAIIVTTLADEIILLNRAAEAMFSCHAHDVTGRTLRNLIPDWGQTWLTGSRDVFRIPPIAKTHGGEIIGRRHDESLFTAEASVAIANSDGEQVRVLVLRDISERKQAEACTIAALDAATGTGDANALLLHELRHRMKNNFQVLLTMIRLEKARPLGSETIAELEDLENRILAFNGVDCELVIAGEDQPIAFATYVRHLMGKLEQIFCHATRPVVLRLALDEIDVPAKKATHLGLLINEAVTNAFKHAVPKGATEITLTVAGQDEAILVTIGDNGPGSDRGAATHAGGTRLMQQLARQIGATLEIDGEPSGMRCVVTVPIVPKRALDALRHDIHPGTLESEQCRRSWCADLR
jgi:PAS domain S-box-containing protein